MFSSSLGFSNFDLYITVFGIGVLLHVFLFKTGEWDTLAAEIVTCFVAIYAIIAAASIYSPITTGGDLWLTIKDVSILFLTLMAGLLASMVIYRSFFHPLRHFPGPFLARISSAYATSLTVRWKFYHEVTQLHSKYGDFVRIGPNQLSVAHPSAVQAVHSISSKCSKAVWYNVQLPAVSLVSSRDRRDHARRRKALDQGLSIQALRSYEPNIKQCTQQLITNIEAHGGNKVDVCDQFTLYGFEVMGTLGFGKNFGLLESQKLHPVMAFLHESLKTTAILSHAMWVLVMLNKILHKMPAMSLAVRKLEDWSDEQVQEHMTNKPEYPSILSWVLRDFMSLPSPSQNDKINLRADATMIVVAGSDTTAVALTCLFMELARHPEVYKTLQKEVDAYLSDKAANKNIMKGLDYVQACINESLRLYPLVPGGVHRQTPPQGLQIGDTFIPGNVVVQTPTYTLHTDKRSFLQPNEFIPERWTTRSELVKDESPYSPFLTGRYSCAGKQLALMEMRHVVCQIASRYDIQFPDPQVPDVFVENLIDGFTLHCPKLELKFLPRSI